MNWLGRTMALAVTAACIAGGVESKSVAGKVDLNNPAVEAEKVTGVESMIINSEGKEKNMIISMDNGKSWSTSIDEDSSESLQPLEEEWWTYEEYKSYIEEQKKELETMIGSECYNEERGWYKWTQEDSDKLIADYENILKDLKNGVKVSKYVGENTDDMIVVYVIDSEEVEVNGVGYDIKGEDGMSITLTEGTKKNQ